MVRAAFIILAIALSACSSCSPTAYYASGMCVITNGHDVDPFVINTAVVETKRALEYAGGLDIDLVSELLDRDASVKFVDAFHKTLQPDKRSPYYGYVGRQYGEDSFVLYRTEKQNSTTLSHELLHFIAIFILGVSNDQSLDHATERLWSSETEITVEDTAANYINAVYDSR